MSKYNYVAKTKDSKTVKGVMNVDTKEELIANLRSQGLFIVSIKKEEEAKQTSTILSLLKIQSRNKRTSVKLHDLTFFARNLATTLSSGITLLRSLEIIAYQTESLKLEKVLGGCCREIRNGLSFCEAIAKYPKIFSTLWVGIIRVGETSGNLPFVLDKLADYLEMRMDFERKIKSALVYPAILVVAVTGAILVFVKVIFPKFSALFEQFDIEFPTATKVLFEVSGFMEKHFVFIVIGFIGIIVLGVFFGRRPEAKKMWDQVSLKIPVINNMFFHLCLERITSTMHILLDSGLPLVYTLEITAQSVGNSVFEKKIVSVSQRVKDGHSLSEEFSKQGIFPLLISEMAKIGEETGNMPDVFERIAVHYRKELTTYVGCIISAFEPLMIIVMGVMIGGIVLALFLPLFKIATAGGM